MKVFSPVFQWIYNITQILLLVILLVSSFFHFVFFYLDLCSTKHWEYLYPFEFNTSGSSFFNSELDTWVFELRHTSFYINFRCRLQLLRVHWFSIGTIDAAELDKWSLFVFHGFYLLVFLALTLSTIPLNCQQFSQRFVCYASSNEHPQIFFIF